MATHSSTSASIKRLASFYRRKGLLLDAEKLYRVALVMQEGELGPFHIDVAVTLYQLAETYSDMDKYTQAEELYHRAVEIYEHGTSGSSHDMLWHLKGLLKIHELAEQEMAATEDDVSAA
jgi:tetratricopeptide (TPR) repeat protein